MDMPVQKRYLHRAGQSKFVSHIHESDCFEKQKNPRKNALMIPCEMLGGPRRRSDHTRIVLPGPPGTSAMLLVQLLEAFSLGASNHIFPRQASTKGTLVEICKQEIVTL